MSSPLDASPKPAEDFQKPLVYSKHLPYAAKLNHEADELLEAIKSNLSASIQGRELWPGALYWTNILNSYLRVYGFRFSKTDHVLLVKLLFELVTIPNLESPLIHSWCHLLARLLRKHRLLSREDLVLPWRPLYELVRRVFQSKFKQLGMKVYSTHACNSLQTLVSRARLYFQVESTQEMLEEWRPLLCPFDLSALEAVNLFSEFLPTVLPPALHPQTIQLWFKEFVLQWLLSNAKSSTEEFAVQLMVRVAKDSIGYIDWSPYMPQVFTRVLRSFQLPVGPKPMMVVSHKDLFDAVKSATLVVSLLGGGGGAQVHLNKLMTALESYYHPSNVGKYSRKLLSFLKELTVQFIRRLKHERYSKPAWFLNTPDEAKLTEEDVDAFVHCLLPAARLAMFSKVGTLEAVISLHNLALVRPDFVLPDLLSRTYLSLETLTEPHQLIATLQCMAAVSRSLLLGPTGRYPEGQNHLFPLLTHALPGIDPNDFRKTLVCGLIISVLVTLVPLVDCSPAIGHSDLTEEQNDLCSLTSQFEDFVLQFLDRCFALVENSGLEQVAAMDRVLSAISTENHESLVGNGITGAVHSIFAQCSPPMFKVALEKLYRFASSHVFESEVSGKMCADMCAAAAKVDAASSLKLFVPHCISTISTILEDPDQKESEHPDNALIWNIQLLSQVLHGQGSKLLPFADDIVACLKSCVHLKCKAAATHASKAVCNALHCLTMTYPLESRSVAVDFGTPPQEHLFIKDWAAAGNIHELAMQWHTPSELELDLVDRLLVEFMLPELQRLQAFIDGDSLDREALRQRLQLLSSIIMGAAPYLPVWEGEQVEGCPISCVTLKRTYFGFGQCERKPPVQFHRESLAKFFQRLTEHILKECEDDTKSISHLAQILKVLMVNFGIGKTDFNSKWKAYKSSKIALENQLQGKKQHIRPMIIGRVHLQHELRAMERGMSVFTPLHFDLTKLILRMSVSAYTEVRIKAQRCLNSVLNQFLYSGRKLLPHILPLLSNNGSISHEQFKGALYVIQNSPVLNVFLHDWPIMKCALPAIIKADHSEKPSILALMTKLQKEMTNSYDTFTIEWQMTLSCITAAAMLHAPLPVESLTEGERRMAEANAMSVRAYGELIDVLVDLAQQEKLQWWYVQMAVHIMVLLIRHDHPLPPSGVRLMINCLTHDALALRKLALMGMTLVLQQQKRKHCKVPVDIEAQAGTKVDNTIRGEREAADWLCYHSERVPRTEEEWNHFPFIDKTHWGYYCWPRTLYTYAPYRDQPQLNRIAEELSEVERVIFTAFTSADYVEKLVSFLSLEENKGKDQYSDSRFSMFKCLFRNFGSAVFEHFKPHLERLAVDSQESSQRCAAEIIAGVLSGSKHWSFEMVKDLQSFMEPLFAKVLDSATQETGEDWGKCLTDVSANRDPHRLGWLLELLMTDPLHGKNGSFLDACRLYLLQAALAQQEWRTASLHHKLLAYLSQHLSHSFKNVRERVGAVLSQLHLYDTELVQVKFNPRRRELMAQLLPQLPLPRQLATINPEDPSLKLSKTVLTWLTFSYTHNDPELFILLAKLLPLVTIDDDEEFGPLLNAASAQISRGELRSEVIPIALDTLIKHSVDSELWRVRMATLHILQVLVFCNLFTLQSHSAEIIDLLLRLMENSQMEVRELAALTVSGLVRCGYFTNIGKLKVLFTKHARTSLPKRARSRAGAPIEDDSGYENLLVKRHSGVLGLAALVEACPYSVPDWLPEVLDEMAAYLHDPAPIQATVKKAMSEFRRTHYDSWSEHKLKFTDDQLAVLADLLISPSYYA